MATKQKFGNIAPQKPRWVDVDQNQYEWVDLVDTETPLVASEQAPAPKRTAIRAAADTGLEVASGAVKGIKFMSDVFGADNAVSTALDDVSKFAKSLQSAQAQGEDARMAQIMKEAEDKGIWEQVKAAASAASEAPIRQSIGAVATGLPMIAASMVPGMREAAWGTRLATMGGLGAAQGVGMVKSSMRDAVYQRAIEEGRSQQEAAELADQAQSYQENPGQIALGGLMGGAATATGFAPAMVRALSPVGANAAKTMSMPTIGKALGMGVLKEVPMEAAQGGHEQLAGNVAQNSAGFATPLGRGVAGSAAMEGMLAAPGGTVGGAFDYRSDRADFKAQQSEKSAAAQAEADAAAAAIRANKQPGNGPLSNAVNAGTEADAQKVEVAGASAAAAIASTPDLADTAPSTPSPEGSAEFINPDFQARQQTLAEQMASPENREKVRARFGDDGLNQVLLQPLGGDAQLGGMVRDPLTLDAPEQTGAQPLGLGLDQTPSGRFTVDARGNAVPETAAQQTEAELRAESLRDEQKLKDDEAAILGQQQTGVRNAPEAPLQPVRRTLTDTNTANMLGTASDPVAGLVTQRRLDADAAAQRKAEEEQRRFEQARSGTLLNVPETRVTQRPLSVERGMNLIYAKANGRALIPQEKGFLDLLRKEMGDDAYAKMAQVAKAPLLFKKQERTAILKPNQDAIAAWEVANAALPSTSKITSSGLGVVTAPTQQSSQGTPNATQASQTQQAAPQQQGTQSAIGGVQGGANAMPVAEGLGASSAPAVQGGPIPAVQVQQGAASQVTAGSKPSKANNLAALQQKLAGQTKPTPATPPAQTKATPAPEAGPTNQGATNGQGQETLLKAEQPTGAAAMVSGAPVAAGSTGNAGGTDSGRATKPERQYNLVAINEKTGKKTQLNATPLTHQQAVTMKSKNNEREGRRIQLEQIVQPSDTTKPGGFIEKAKKAAGKVDAPKADKPQVFKTADAADYARAGNPATQKRKVKGGYILVERTAKQIAAAANNARKNFGKVNPDGGPLSAHQYIASEGGIATSAMADLGFDRNLKVGSKFLFTKNGMTLERMTEALQQAGYMDGTNQNEAIKLVSESAKGRPQYTADGWEQIAQADANVQFDDFMAAQEEMAQADDFNPFDSLAEAGFLEQDADAAGFYEQSEQIQNEISALQSSLESMNIDPVDISDSVHRDNPQATQDEFYARYKAALQQAIDAESAKEAKPASSGSARQDAGSQSGAGAQSEGLTSPTKADIESQQARAEQAAKAKAAQDKADTARAAKERERKEVAAASVAAADTFELGQDAMANLTGQNDLQFSRAAAKDVRDLVTLHNLSEDNLMYAGKMGGIPVPSIGITKVETPFGGFGGITLIAPKDLIDPESGVPVYDRDAWTARFPTLNFKKIKAKVADAFYERMSSARDLGGDGGQFMSSLFDELRNARVQSPDKITSLFTRYSAPKMLYAQEALGKAIKPQMRGIKPETPFGHTKAWRDFVAKSDTRNMTEQREREFNREAAVAARAAMTELGETRKEGADERTARMLDSSLKSYLDRYITEDGMNAGILDRALRDVKSFGQKEIDPMKMDEAVRKVVPLDDAGYKKWVAGLVEPLFEAPTITVRGSEVPVTLENVVDAMTIGKTAGAEKSMTFGVGKAASMLGKQFKSIDEIKAARDQVVSAASEKEGKKSTEALISEYQNHVSAFYTGKDWKGSIDTWAALDSSLEALTKAGRNPTDGTMNIALQRSGFKRVDAKGISLAKQALEALRDATTDYFEAKPQRAVRLNEFKGAVVPKGTSAEAIALLEENGITVEVHGNAEGAREKAIQKLAKKLDGKTGNVIFSRDTESPRTPAATIRAAITKAYGNLLDKLEAKGLVTIAQTEREAIEAAAQARADKTGGDVEQIKRQMLASMIGETEGIIRVSTINAPNGTKWVVTRNIFNGKDHLGYFDTEAEANEYAEQERTEAKRSEGKGARWWVENPPKLIQSTSLGRLDSLGRARALKSTLDARQSRVTSFADGDGLSQIKDRAGFCFKLAAEASAAGVGNMHIGIAENDGDPVWHAVVERDGEIYDPTFGRWFAPGVYESFGFRRHTSISSAAVRDYIATSGGFAPDAGRLQLDMNSGGGSLDPNSLDVKRSSNGNIEGFFDKQTGKSFLVADNLTAASAPGTLMHEVGIHMAADGKMDALFKRAGTLLKTGTQNEFIQRVKARMARAGETSDEEAAAYIVTEYENDRAKAPITIGKWLADLTAAVRAWLFSKGIILKAEQLTVADIAAVARANARSLAKGGPNGGPGGGIRRSFAGEGAATADKMALATARQRVEAGENAETVRKETGWFKGVDGKWRFEISDSDASIKDRSKWTAKIDGLKSMRDAALRRKFEAEEKRNAFLRSRGESPSRISSETKREPEFKALVKALNTAELAVEKSRSSVFMAEQDGGLIKVGDVLDHPALFSAYPKISETRVAFDNGLQKGNAAYSPESNTITIPGMDDSKQLLTVLLHEIQHGIQNIEGFATGGSPDLNGGFSAYKRLAGEVESRNTEARQGMTDAQRRETAPSATADTPDSDVIVVFNGKDAMSAPAPANADPDIRFSRAADMAGNAIDKAKQTADKAMGKDFPRAASMPDLNDDQRSLLGKVGASQSPASDAIKAATDRAGLKIRQGMVDRFAALKELDEKALGQNFIADSITNSAWVLAKMSSAGSGALNAMMKSGRIEMDAQQKVIGLKGAPNGGLTASLQKLGGPAEVERFFAWVAANRAEKLMGEGRENLFTPAEIAAGKTLNTGTTEGGKVRPALYGQVHAEFQQYRDDVLAIAEQAGIINSENRAMWRDEFYVPFYRVMEDDADRGRSGGNGLSRQEAYKKLKGGKQSLNDLMENTLMNFHHLLSASLKNQAAVQAIKNAEHVGIARKVPEARRDTKTSTFVLVDGKKVFYEVDDPLVFESITTLADPGLNNTAVRVMGAFKRLFTNMTTSTPQFIIANTFRDLLQASATSPTSKNIAKNLKEGIQSYRDEKTRAEMLASGGAFSFGHIYGMSADEVKESLQKTVAGAGLISSQSMIPSILRKGWDAWGDITDLSENASRAATYTQNVDELGKLRAAFEARDVMDFSQHGAWPAVRLLVRIVPFLNARLQGLDKLYRSGLKPSILTAMGKGTDTDKQAAARFAMVTGALTLATMALYLVNADDDEYKKLEEWQKDTYWFIRIGENAFFLPKPFEVGAIATMAERTLQQAMDDKATGKLFRERMWEMLMQTFAFNPTPQMFQPLIDVYSNKDAFTGRDIESAGMERMSTGLRSRDTTTAPATALSAVSRVFGDESSIAVSPVQADHLIKGYLGGVGAMAAGWLDTMYRAATGQSSPDKAWSEYQPIRRFYRDLDVPVANTRYTTLFYDGLKEANRVYADVMELQKLGRTEEAQALSTDKRSVLQMRIALNAQQRRLTEINNRMKEVRRSDRDGEWKRRELDLLTTQKALITERMGKRIEEARATQ